MGRDDFHPCTVTWRYFHEIWVHAHSTKDLTYVYYQRSYLLLQCLEFVDESAQEQSGQELLVFVWTNWRRAVAALNSSCTTLLLCTMALMVWRCYLYWSLDIDLPAGSRFGCSLCLLLFNGHFFFCHAGLQVQTAHPSKVGFYTPRDGSVLQRLHLWGWF